MKQEELIKQLDEQAPVRERMEWQHVSEAGRIKIADIDKVEPKDFDMTDKDGKQKVVTRFFLTVKNNPKSILVPKSIMTQLNELMKKGNVISFSVIKTGTGIGTKYTLVPEMIA